MIYIEYVLGRKRIYGFNDKQLSKIKEDLIFLNPEWVQVQ